MLKFIPEKATKKEIEKAAEKIRKKFINELKKMEEELRLSSDWLEKFIQDIVKLYDQQSKFFGFDADFHAGNVGIRRVGAEGYLKFFD